MPSSAGLSQEQALHLQAWDQMEQWLDLSLEDFLLGCLGAGQAGPLPTTGLGAHYSNQTG